jgi:PAS domain S-box-containing protein
MDLRNVARAMRRKSWLIYLIAGNLVLAAFLVVPGMRAGPVFNIIGLSGAIVILVALRLHRPEQRLPWFLVATGQILFVGGDIITYNYTRFFGTDPPFPSLGDLFYLSVYPFLVAGILLLVRRRSPGRDRAGLIDSLIVGIGVGAISWVFLIAPYAHDPTLTLSQKLVAIGYPVMDLVLFTVAVRLAVGLGTRSPAFYLMVSSVAVLFITDSIYGWIVLHGGYDNTTGFLEGGWGLFYLLWGAAALHPSMRLFDRRAPEHQSRQPRRRLFLLAGASLMAPAVNFVQAIRGESIDVPVVAGAGAVLFVLVLIRLNGLMVDVTEYRRTARKLQEAEAKYRSLVEGLPAVVYIAEFGEEGDWSYISPQIETILGFTQEEFRAASVWRDRIVPEDRRRALEAEVRVLRGEGRLQCEYRIVGKDGRLIWIREEADAVKDEAGKPLYLQGAMYDITELKLAEEKLVTALDTEKEATKRLRALHEMQNSFLQAVSHELRTPLTTIMGSALTLEADEGNLSRSDATELLGLIAGNARKLHRLLTNLLDLDRMSRGIIEPKRELTDITTVLANALAECKSESHPIQLTTGAPLFVEVDAAQVERIIENLVTNALRYTPPGTPIWVSATPSNGGALLTVEDAGHGIPEAVRKSIFEPFQQGREVVPHSPGVGIGLSLVSRFAELHGGRAWVEDREGGGASFKVLLPKPREASEPRDSGPEKPHVADGSGNGLPRTEMTPSPP